MSTSEENRWRELRLDRALGELSRETGALRASLQSGDPDDYELAAAAVYLALGSARAPLPGGLRQRVQDRAFDIVGPNPPVSHP